MADITLSDGQEIFFDLGEITISEYRSLFRPGQGDDEDFAILSKASNLKAEDIGGLSFNDWRRFFKAFVNKAAEPLEDPN